jgi:hypothetical protein
MAYVKIVNGQPALYSYGQLRRDNPNTSFPKHPDDAFLAQWGMYPLTLVPLPDVDYTKNVEEGTPALIDGVWTQVWVVTDATAEEIEQRKANQLESIKQQRAYAYRDEADPLFFKAQRDEGTIEEWEAKVQEIRDRFPYPEEQV